MRYTMMVSNIMVVNDLGASRRNDGVRCSIRVMDGICSHMAQPSSSNNPLTESICVPSMTSYECPVESPKESSLHPISQAVGPLYQLEDFDIQQMLGEGFFSKVLKVKHRETNEIMVLKVSKSLPNCSRRSSHEAAAKEADMMRKLKHPNILNLKGVCVERGNSGSWDMHLLVDFCQGGSLSRLILNKLSYFPWQLRMKYSLDIALAMEYLHSQKIIHRDLTSMNVLLRSSDGPFDMTSSKAIVADFGLSCSFPRRGQKLPQVGTTYFMSPECLKEEFYDEKSDVFSFGIILCQLIARIDADPDSGLHRTSSFGLHYVLFTPCCPPDTPIDLLKLAFNCCLLDPLVRPSFSSIARLISKMVQECRLFPESDVSLDSRLGRSRSDAALKRPRGAAARKLSSTLTANPTPIIEGMVDESSIFAMNELARDAAREEPSPHATNPFLEHERFRKERKIIPKGEGRRRSETRPEVSHSDTDCNPKRIYRRRCSSMPSPSCLLSGSLESIEEEVDTSPGRIPMIYRDYDLNFVKSLKRFPSRRHTLIPECHVAKSSVELHEKKRFDNDWLETNFTAIKNPTSSVFFSPSFSSDETENLQTPEVVTVQPVSIISSMSSLPSSEDFTNGDHLNNNIMVKSWDNMGSLAETIVKEKPSIQEKMCSSAIQRRNPRCIIL